AAIVAGVGFAIAFERARAARAEQSIANVAALFAKADWFRGQARRIPPDQLGPWQRALAHVRMTAEVVGAGAVDDKTRRNVSRLILELKDEERRIRERIQQQRELTR